MFLGVACVLRPPIGATAERPTRRCTSAKRMPSSWEPESSSILARSTLSIPTSLRSLGQPALLVVWRPPASQRCDVLIKMIASRSIAHILIFRTIFRSKDSEKILYSESGTWNMHKRSTVDRIGLRPNCMYEPLCLPEGR